MPGRSDTRSLTKDERSRLAEVRELVTEVKSERDRLIRTLYKEGVALRPIAEFLGMSKSRVHQIVTEPVAEPVVMS